MNKLFQSNKFLFATFSVVIFFATFVITFLSLIGVNNIFTNYPKAEANTSGVYIKVSIGNAVEWMNMSTHTTPQTAYKITPIGNTKLDFYAYTDSKNTLSTSCSKVYKMYFHDSNWLYPYTYETKNIAPCSFTENIDISKIYAAGYFKYELSYKDASGNIVNSTFWTYIEPKYANSICKTPSTSNDQIKKCLFYKCINGDTNKDGVCDLKDTGATETIFENGINNVVINNRADCYKYGPTPTYVNGINVTPLCYQYDFHDGSDLICSSDATFKEADVNKIFALTTDVCTSTANICGDGILRGGEKCEYRKETNISYDANGNPLPANKVCNNCQIEDKVTSCNATSCKVNYDNNGCWTISDNGTGQCTSQLTNNSVHAVYFKCSSLTDGKCGCQDATGANITPNSDYSNCKNLYQGGNIEIGKAYCPATYFDKPDNSKSCAQVDFTCAMNGTPAGGSAACYTPPVAKPDLVIEKLVNGNKDIVVKKDTEVTFSLKVTNIGEGSVNDKVSVTDTMLSGLTLIVNPSGTGWSCNVTLPTFTCTTVSNVTLAKNASLDLITFKAKPTEYNKIYTNLVSVKLNTQTESNINNNSSSAAVGTNPEVVVTKCSIGDKVWNDANNNGILDNNETGIAGATLTLYAQNGTTVIATTTTDQSGNYKFTNLDCITYIVKVTSGVSGNNTTGNANGQTVVLNSTTNKDPVNVDFGYYKAKTCADITFNPATPIQMTCGNTVDFSFDPGALRSVPTIVSGSQFGSISYYKLDEYAAVQMKITANQNVNGDINIDLPIKQANGETMNCPVAVKVSCVMPTNPKLSITKTILQNNVSSISYNIAVKNEGDVEVKDVRILDNYDAIRLSLASTNPTFDSNNDASSIGTFVINNIGTLSVGAVKNITVTFNIKQNAPAGLACNYGGQASGNAVKNSNNETTQVIASFADTANSLCTNVIIVTKDKAYVNLTKVNKTAPVVEIGQKVQWEITAKDLCSGNCDPITSLKFVDSFNKNYLTLNSVFVQKKNSDGTNASENIALNLDINSTTGDTYTFGANNVLVQLGNNLNSAQYLVFNVYTTTIKVGGNVMNTAQVTGPNNDATAQATVTIKAKPEVIPCAIGKDGKCINGQTDKTTPTLPKTAGFWTFDNIPESLIVAIIFAALFIALGVAYPTLRKMNYSK